MYKPQKFMTLKKISITVVALMLGYGLYFVYSHGFVAIQDYTKGKDVASLEYSSGLSKSPSFTNGSPLFLSNSTYAVSSKASDGNVTTSEVQVPSFLQTASTPKRIAAKHIDTVSRYSLQQPIQEASGRVSSTDITSVRQSDDKALSSDFFNERRIDIMDSYESSVAFNASIICGTQLINDQTELSCYDNKTISKIVFPAIQNKRAVSLISNTGSFVVYDSNKNDIFINNPTSKKQERVSLADGVDVSLNEGRPVLSANSALLAVVTGRDYRGSGDGEGENPIKEKAQSQDLILIDPKSNKELFQKNYSKTFITSISLSPNAKYIAVTTTNQTAFYRTDTGFDKPEYILPYRPSTDIVWQDDNRLVLTTETDGMLYGSITDKTFSTVVSYDTIRPTSVGFIDGNALYFTGFSAAIMGAKQPSLYRALLDTDNTVVSRASIEKFPHQGDGFYVDVIEKNIIIQLTRYREGNEYTISEETRKKALDYTASTLGENNGYKVEYSYIDFD